MSIARSPFTTACDIFCRGVNFFRADDLQFLQALQRGEHQSQGVRNRTLQLHPPGWKPSRIGRTLRRFRVLKLIKLVAGTRKYYPTRRAAKVSSSRNCT